jgi:hypothetical protein
VNGREWKRNGVRVEEVIGEAAEISVEAGRCAHWKDRGRDERVRNGL